MDGGSTGQGLPLRSFRFIYMGVATHLLINMSIGMLAEAGSNLNVK